MNVLDWALDMLFPPREHDRALRDVSTDTFAHHVSPTRIPLTGGSSATALLPYRGIVQSAVIEAKYHDTQSAQALLAHVLADYLLEFSSDEGALLGNLALVPIPLSRERLRDRGYNQVERICHIAAQRLGGEMPLMPDILNRVRDTAPQTRLSGEERRENMYGAFVAAPGIDTSYTYIVVDDVITTGATLAAAIAALTAAGARVIPLALAR